MFKFIQATDTEIAMAASEFFMTDDDAKIEIV